LFIREALPARTKVLALKGEGKSKTRSCRDRFRERTGTHFNCFSTREVPHPGMGGEGKGGENSFRVMESEKKKFTASSSIKEDLALNSRYEGTCPR